MAKGDACMGTTTTNFIHTMADAARASGFSVEQYGTASEYPLHVYQRRAARDPAPTVYISTGMHGDEPAGPHTLMELLQQGALPDSFHWIIFPLLNPTGFNTRTRENAQGIDLNRDYLSLLSEEAKAHAHWLKTHQHCIDLYLSLHEDWEAKGFYLYEINTSPLSGQAELILKTVSGVIPLETGPVVDDHELTKPGLIRHLPEPDEPEGWPEAIFACKSYPLLSYTFESPSSLPLAQRITSLKLATLSALRCLE